MTNEKFLTCGLSSKILVLQQHYCSNFPSYPIWITDTSEENVWKRYEEEDNSYFFTFLEKTAGEYNDPLVFPLMEDIPINHMLKALQHQVERHRLLVDSFIVMNPAISTLMRSSIHDWQKYSKQELEAVFGSLWSVNIRELHGSSKTQMIAITEGKYVGNKHFVEDPVCERVRDDFWTIRANISYEIHNPRAMAAWVCPRLPAWYPAD